jgi:hypothetical protein
MVAGSGGLGQACIHIDGFRPAGQVPERRRHFKRAVAGKDTRCRPRIRYPRKIAAGDEATEGFKAGRIDELFGLGALSQIERQEPERGDRAETAKGILNGSGSCCPAPMLLLSRKVGHLEEELTLRCEASRHLIRRSLLSGSRFGDGSPWRPPRHRRSQCVPSLRSSLAQPTPRQQSHLYHRPARL